MNRPWPVKHSCIAKRLRAMREYVDVLAALSKKQALYEFELWALTQPEENLGLVGELKAQLRRKLEHR